MNLENNKISEIDILCNIKELLFLNLNSNLLTYIPKLPKNLIYISIRDNKLKEKGRRNVYLNKLGSLIMFQFNFSNGLKYIYRWRKVSLDYNKK